MKFCTLEEAHNSTVWNWWFKNIVIGHITLESQFNLLRAVMVEFARIVLRFYRFLEDARKFITLITYSPGMTYSFVLQYGEIARPFNT
jgi:hypothetical protein